MENKIHTLFFVCLNIMTPKVFYFKNQLKFIEYEKQSFITSICFLNRHSRNIMSNKQKQQNNEHNNRKQLRCKPIYGFLV